MTLTLTPLEHAYVAAATRDDQAEAARLAALIDAEQAEREARLAAPGALRDAAHWYATLGLPVFPCAPGGKRPATAHGFKDATTDHDQINRWWKVRPDYNVAIAVGHKFDVFDIDGPEGLLAFGPYLDARTLDIRALALTPRGRHYYVPAAGQPNAVGILPQVDHRGIGGYVVAPPSRTPTGAYRWSTPPTLT